jgi:hypothetical protein
MFAFSPLAPMMISLLPMDPILIEKKSFPGNLLRTNLYALKLNSSLVIHGLKMNPPQVHQSIFYLIEILVGIFLATSCAWPPLVRPFICGFGLRLSQCPELTGSKFRGF